ncbi:MAG TPA: 16S rRNA (guanine(966)-N(2))-methyltransferase RsmD [Tepidiformaceae bacterium]|nr:16S rRNA (guanine(966)-N(2))-methyltransferase RsmD [Tepidiformaceae bacterium]
MAARGVRITGGTARGIPLTEPKGHRLRPTSGLVREAIFNILAGRIEGAAVLDLFAGTGALGIEALSRGATSATFVDSESSACQAIIQSLSRTALSDRGTVLRGSLPAALAQLNATFDVVLLDPPYDAPDIPELLTRLAAYLRPAGVVVYEHGSRYNPPGRPEGLHLGDRRTYGDSAIAIYDLQEGQ